MLELTNTDDFFVDFFRLCSKFRVNSMDKKAKYLEKKVDEFVNSSLLETKVEEKETQVLRSLINCQKITPVLYLVQVEVLLLKYRTLFEIVDVCLR